MSSIVILAVAVALISWQCVQWRRPPPTSMGSVWLRAFPWTTRQGISSTYTDRDQLSAMATCEEPDPRGAVGLEAIEIAAQSGADDLPRSACEPPRFIKLSGAHRMRTTPSDCARVATARGSCHRRAPFSWPSTTRSALSHAGRASSSRKRTGPPILGQLCSTSRQTMLAAAQLRI